VPRALAPLDNLYRGRVRGVALRSTRAADTDDAGEPQADGSTMVGHFAVFDVWTEIHSWYEGDFLERLAPGAFRKTLKENRDDLVVQFDHGYDPHVGDSPLGVIDDVREDDEGVWYEVPLLDTDYNRDRILPMLSGRTIAGEDRGSVLGSSFRFRVVKDEWNREPKPSDDNPDGLPERTIREVRLYEFGPVVFPAYREASAGVRSLTDHFLERRRQLRSDPTDPGGADPAVTPPVDPDEPTPRHSTDSTGARLARRQAELLSLRRP
jgi:HK97 family phage prohead protease